MFKTLNCINITKFIKELLKEKRRRKLEAKTLSNIFKNRLITGDVHFFCSVQGVIYILEMLLNTLTLFITGSFSEK